MAKTGAWSSGVLAGLGIVYMGLVAGSVIAGGGLMPGEPWQTVIHVLVMIMAGWMVFLWAVLHRSTPEDRKAFYF